MQGTSSMGGKRSRGEVAALTETMHTSGESWAKMRVMSSRKRYGVIVWLLALGLGVLGACAAKRSVESRPPEAAEAAGAWQSDTSVEELELALGDEEQRLRAAGIALPTNLVASSGGQDSVVADASPDVPPAQPSPEPSPEPAVATESLEVESSRASRRRCKDVCDLAGSICDLEAHICSLASRHAGEARYAAVCERASGDCDAAQEACNACE